MSIESIIIRFLLGGSVVALSSVIGKKLGGRLGGIFAAFPAVYASAVISVSVNFPHSIAIQRAIDVSKGALIGNILNIPCAIAAGYLMARYGWKRGLFYSLSGWLIFAIAVFACGITYGWMK
jgi:uncharacterized membrane protein (GlpM family)